MKKTKIGMLLNTGRCIGCLSCQVACREENDYGYDERWMECVRRDPYYVDGELRMYHMVAPSLDKCADCIEKTKIPLCIKVCPGKALHVGPINELIPIMSQQKRQCILYSS